MLEINTHCKSTIFNKLKKKNQWLPVEQGREGGRSKLGIRDSEIQTAMYKIDKQQGCTEQYRKLGP